MNATAKTPIVRHPWPRTYRDEDKLAMNEIRIIMLPVLLTIRYIDDDRHTEAFAAVWNTAARALDQLREQTDIRDMDPRSEARDSARDAFALAACARDLASRMLDSHSDERLDVTFPALEFLGELIDRHIIAALPLSNVQQDLAQWARNGAS